MIVGQATGAGWQERLARLAAPHVPEVGFTLVTLDHTGAVDVRKTYDTRTAAFGQATKIGDQTQVNAYVLTKPEGRVVVWTGPRATLISVNVQEAKGRKAKQGTRPGMAVELEGDRIFVRFDRANGAAQIAAENVLREGGFSRYHKRWTRFASQEARGVVRRAEAVYETAYANAGHGNGGARKSRGM